MQQTPWFSNSKIELIPVDRPFIKMHGLRNDFVIIDGRHIPFSPNAAKIVHICDRHEGIGADGLVIVENPPSEAAASGVIAFIRIFNPDGRQVEACGNATRCVGWLLMQESGLKTITVQTLGGRLICHDKGNNVVAIEMGILRTGWQEIPLAQEMDTLHLGIGSGPLQDPVGMNIGNPHAVFFIDDLAAVDLTRHGPMLQKNPLFPQEANIGVAQLIDSKTLKLSVWERPGVLTTSCGTGACAAVGAARRRGLTDQRAVRVIMPAGNLDIEIDDNDATTMTGPVETCYTGYLPLS